MRRHNPYHPYQQWGPQQGWPGHPGPGNIPHQQQMHRQITIEDAISIARDQIPGEVVKAELDREHGRLVYEVEIISTQGPKYEVEVDASTGNIVHIELD